MRSIFIVLVVIFFTPLQLTSEVLELETMADLENYVEEGTMVLIDLDHTLFEGTTSWGHAAWYYEEIEGGITQGLDHDTSVTKFYPHWIISQAACNVKPLEECTPRVIRSLQEKGFIVMGFTHRQPSIAIPTLDLIYSIDVDFEKNAILETELVLDFPNPPKYIEGVIFVAEYNGKGEVLRKFLDVTKHQPKKVVFVDDKLVHLQSVDEALNEMGIEYVGLHYPLYEKNSKFYDFEILQVQRQLYHDILSNEAAECLLYCH